MIGDQISSSHIAIRYLMHLEDALGGAENLPTQDPRSRLQKEIQATLNSTFNNMTIAPLLYGFGDMLPFAQKTWAILVMDALKLFPRSSFKIFAKDRILKKCQIADQKGRLAEFQKGRPLEGLYDDLERNPAAAVVVEGCVDQDDFDVLADELIPVTQRSLMSSSLHLIEILMESHQTFMPRIVKDGNGKVTFRLGSPSLLFERLFEVHKRRIVFEEGFEERGFYNKYNFAPVPLSFYKKFGPFAGLPQEINAADFIRLDPLMAFYVGAWLMKF